jgi:uncharacterized membrane protein AbrB (regulator of aidB expression)
MSKFNNKISIRNVFSLIFEIWRYKIALFYVIVVFLLLASTHAKYIIKITNYRFFFSVFCLQPGTQQTPPRLIPLFFSK